ncbi:MAG TPA: alpha/beta hydrolase [Arenibaculum sp.]|nr:alpha/beta hydrolase [Arenibaculum sp.]
MLDVLAIGAAAYGGMIGLLYAGQRNLLYFPHRRAVEPAAWGVPDMAPVRVRTADGLSLTGWYRAPPAGRPAPVIVLFHGNAGHLGLRGFKARLFLDAGYGVLLAGYRGFAGNPGRPSEPGLHADARAVLDHLLADGIPPERLVLYGESLGTGVAVRMAAERRFAALVLEAPYTSVADVGAIRFPWAPVRLLMHDRFDSLSRIPQAEMPLLVVHGERDRIVPVHLGRRLFAAAQEPKRAVWLSHAGHNDVYDHGAGRAVLDFLKEHDLAGRAA